MRNLLITVILFTAVHTDVNGALRALREIESSKIVIV
jgi:hypothetical protein